MTTQGFVMKNDKGEDCEIVIMPDGTLVQVDRTPERRTVTMSGLVYGVIVPERRKDGASGR